MRSGEYEPPIFVRALTEVERDRLEAGLRAPTVFELGRCQILLASDRGEWVPRIATTLGCDETIRQAGSGVRLIACYLPSKSPWLNSGWQESQAILVQDEDAHADEEQREGAT